MKIALYDDSYFPRIDGVAITINNYAKIINEKDDTAYVVTCKVPGYDDSNSSYEIFRSKIVPFLQPRGYSLPITIFDFKLKKQLLKYDTDIIHVHSPFIMGRLGLKIAKKKNVPVIATFHSKFYDDFYQVTKSKFLSKLMLKYVINFHNKADYVWTMNESTVQTLREYGYKGEVDIVPNGVDIKKPDNSQDLILKAKERYDLKGDVFLYVGQHSWVKNLRLMFQAVSRYKKTNPNFKLVMVGDGDSINSLKKLAKDLDILDNVIFTGRISDREELISIYLSADVFLFPSIYDTCGLVVKEAAVCECPSIVVKGMGTAEGIVDEVNGFLCDNTEESICDAMIRSMSDKTKLKQISKNAAETLPISWEEATGIAYDKYKQILNNK